MFTPDTRGPRLEPKQWLAAREEEAACALGLVLTPGEADHPGGAPPARGRSYLGPPTEEGFFRGTLGFNRPSHAPAALSNKYGRVEIPLKAERNRTKFSRKTKRNGKKDDIYSFRVSFRWDSTGVSVYSVSFSVSFVFRCKILLYSQLL